MAGKGDKPRPCDRDKYRANYDRIYGASNVSDEVAMKALKGIKRLHGYGKD